MIRYKNKRYRVKWFNLLLILFIVYQVYYNLRLAYQISHDPVRQAEYVEQLKHDVTKGH